MGKKILVVGQGGREHALVWKLSQSPQADKIYAAPGNPGIAQLAQCVDIAASDVSGLLDFARKEKIDLTVVGPEDPLMAGIVDAFKEQGLRIFGPTAKAAQLEGSKVFAKELMRKYNIPTAEYRVFDEPEAAIAFACSFTDRGQPVVIKADGLAAGKGVIIAAGSQEARQAVNEIMQERVFGDAGRRVVVEEFLEGEEVSVFALADGQRAVFLVAAQDHKRVFDNDQGPNTGGMGAYTHPPIYTQAVHEQVDRLILQPTVRAMAQEGCPYQGVLYAGLMITPSGPKVLEFNARFGDPETQVIMPVIEGDLLPLLEAAVDGDLSSVDIKVRPDYCVCVILASGGYPGTYQKGYPIKGLENLAENTLVFHAGTALQNGQLVTGGGRVMALVTRAGSMEEALTAVYSQIKHVHFTGMHYRTDIGRRAFNRRS
ncbi:MAG TPA: phosphoribosylamine--glycine ligase [Syntrophomonadaceae bacterium]|jgi:phosphoribosylamine--glycine ligase|nr:phosphoribosylamine--glycine ligase [Syntrophomonadaceae bacterium]HOQ09224.1 phosphoribosylamine--glycine ligase [Syntrophomonadaceae bacterium]HPU49076.1 phosphoribosylamine--glycine ligase [Syntrophomonadaceae bacterium]